MANLDGNQRSSPTFTPSLRYAGDHAAWNARSYLPTGIKADGQKMTPNQSKQLKIGTRVCFNGDQTDRGKITAIEARYVTIKWDDGHQSFSGHDAMDRVELLAAKR
jgi:hypothetical protein